LLKTKQFSTVIQIRFSAAEPLCKHVTGDGSKMSIARKLGILVFFMVPAIIGGGIIFHYFHTYTPVVIYLIVLYLIAGGFLSR
jgi:hypothetical protein